MVKGFVGRPHLAQQAQVFVGAGVAVVVAHKVAIALLVFVRPAGDVVHGHAAAGVVVERGELACGQRGRHKAGAVGQQKLDLVGDGRCVIDGEQRVRAGGAGGHQDAVKARVLVRLRKHAHVGWIDCRAFAGDGFRDFVRLDHADELDGHSGLLEQGRGGNLQPMICARPGHANEEKRVCKLWLCIPGHRKASTARKTRESGESGERC